MNKKPTRRIFTATMLRTLGLGMLCAVGAFAMGIQTAGDVHPFATSEAALQEFVRGNAGDVNDDGKIDADDAYLLYQFAQGLETPSPRQIKTGDTNGDGKLTESDLGYVLRHLSLR